VDQTTWLWSLNLLLSGVSDPYYNVCCKYCYDIKCCNTYAGDISVSLAVQLLTCLLCVVTKLLEFCSCILMFFSCLLIALLVTRFVVITSLKRSLIFEYNKFKYSYDVYLLFGIIMKLGF